MVLATSDGRVLASQSSQVDVISPLTNPVVLATNPPDGSVAALPLPIITVTFDQGMVAGSTADPASATNSANYTLVGADGTAATVDAVTYDSASDTALLQVEGLRPEQYTLTILGLRSRAQAAIPWLGRSFTVYAQRRQRCLELCLDTTDGHAARPSRPDCHVPGDDHHHGRLRPTAPLAADA